MTLLKHKEIIHRFHLFNNVIQSVCWDNIVSKQQNLNKSKIEFNH